MGDTTTILPADNDIQEAPRIIIEPGITAPDGSFYVFDGADGYRQVVEPWAVADHVGPAKGVLKLGDVPSWVAHVARYARPDRLLLTWSEAGLRAVFDSHASLEEPGRAQWAAEHPFLTSDQWKAWRTFANGTRWSQQQAVDKLDELADDIVDPDAATVLDIIRTLRSTVKMDATSELREDGSSLVSFSKDSAIKSKKPIPSEIEIVIPVLKGHVRDRDETITHAQGSNGGPPPTVLKAGTPVTYRLPVKVRPSVDDATHTLGFRFLMPTAERVLEAVYADRVAAAKALLGDLGDSLLRAAS